ncbi:MAG TPA: PAS domain-containing protein, partial [Longimicrobium sp.]|uniref:PAS domain-containing protein n=1 Tax=Longimicrobium sp. TaxID=2029185 RepID=UPI002ED928EC
MTARDRDPEHDVRRSLQRLDALVHARREAGEPDPAGLEDIRQSIEALYTAMEELRVAEEELRVQNEQLELSQVQAAIERQRYLELFQLAPDPYLVTTVEGVILDANYAASALAGISADRLVGQPLVTLVVPEARRTFRGVLTRAIPLGRLDDWEVRVRPRGGDAPVDVSCSVTVVLNEEGDPAHLRWILRDISERRRAEQTARALAREEAAHAEAEAGRARLQGVLEGISDAFVGVDAHWQITYVNRRAAEMWHRSRDQLRGRLLWRELSAAVGSEPHAALLRAMDTREMVERETRFPVGRRWIELRAYPAEEGGMSIFFRDITTRREHEAERQRLLAQAQAQRALLETALRNIPGGMVIVEAPDARMVLHNEEAARILAHPLHEEGGVDALARHYGMLRPDGAPAPAETYPIFR